MRWHLLGTVVAVSLLIPLSTANAELPGGIGILGDSYSDEYQFYPPDRSTARNWMEILAATRGLNFGAFSSIGRGEPRNQGFEYNWARSDATTVDLIATGQHSGVASQVERGEVKLVWIFIGGNDFINALKSPEPVKALDEALPRVQANFRTVVDTILSSHAEVKLVVATVPDIRYLPEFAAPLRAGRLPRAVADRFTAAIKRYNAQIRLTARSNPRVALIDLDLTTTLANLVSLETVAIAGQRLDRLKPSNEPGHFFLADQRHPGTLGHALVAKMFIDLVNARFDAGIAPLSDEEVLKFASSLPGPDLSHSGSRVVDAPTVRTPP